MALEEVAGGLGTSADASVLETCMEISQPKKGEPPPSAPNLAYSGLRHTLRTAHMP